MKIPPSSFPRFCGRVLQRQPWRLEPGTFTLFATMRLTLPLIQNLRGYDDNIKVIIIFFDDCIKNYKFDLPKQ
ncbi:MAG: hypothetical protein MI862_13530, partial [Desulfobacterales bacterium]|nr:hypothetical protein [Desulfobacterales bacterium]